MWQNFDENDNTFLLALNHATGKDFRGYSLKTLPKCTQPLVTIFGPFGNSWKKIKGRKVFFTGENVGPIFHEDILNVGFQNLIKPYIRIPIWMLSLDIYKPAPKLRNPFPLPIHTCTETPFLTLDRPKFCAFVVSNGKNHIRNSAFHALTKYKKVDSAGKLFNTIGNEIFSRAEGKDKKHEFLKKYRFCLAYENELGDGYVTEKLLHAKAAGCVPIYWGSDTAITDFNPRGFINASHLSEEEMIDKVKEVEENPEKWKEIASVPLFFPETLRNVYERFQELTDYITDTSS